MGKGYFLLVVFSYGRLEFSMSIGDMYKVVVSGTYLGEEFSNRYYYQQINGAGGAPALCQGIIDQLLPALSLCQSDQMSYLSVEASNFNDLADFIVTPVVPNVVGTLTGSPMPSYVAWGFKLERDNRVMRPGSKRLVGVTEPSTDGNDPTPTLLSILNGVAGAFIANVTWGVDNEWTPKLVREVPSGTVGVVAGIPNASFRWLTTQNSRKVD